MVAANSYFISESNSLENPKSVIGKDDFGEKLLDSGFKFLISLLTIKQIGIVSAIDDDPVLDCCIEKNDGAICQPVLSTFTDCKTELAHTSCDNLADCQLGCCIDTEYGSCAPRSPQKECNDGGGDWRTGEECSITECQYGCCVLNNQASFITETTCGFLAADRGVEKDFRDINNAFECYSLFEGERVGACVYESGNCEYIRENLCTDGDFYNEVLCSDPLLDTISICESLGEERCVDDRIEIFNKDSCGNAGEILDSCEPGKTRCFDDGVGDVYCKEVACTGPNTANVGEQGRFNGETWCLFDGVVGEGKDTVGSEHWIASCTNGGVNVTMAGTGFRSSICEESKMESNGKTFSIAKAMPNQATICKIYNPEITEDMDEDEVEDEVEKMKEKCESNSHCMVQHTHVGKYFDFDLCVPAYPKGANLKDGLDDNLCSMATIDCIKYYVKKVSGWDCIGNCKCSTSKVVEEMNNLCTSMGDCGSYVNYLGEGTNNARSKRPQSSQFMQNIWCDNYDENHPMWNFFNCGNDEFYIADWRDFNNNYETPVSNQEPVGKTDLSEYYAAIDDDFRIAAAGGMTLEEYFEANPEKMGQILGNVAGATGISYLATIALVGTHYFVATALPTGLGIWAISSAPFLPVFFIGGIVAAIGAAIGAKIAEKTGATGPDANRYILEGALAALALVAFAMDWNPIGWALTVVVVLLELANWLFGWGDTKEKVYQFECLPWQAPTGAQDCEACNEDPNRPCTEYRCSSIGQTCVLLNGDSSDRPECISLEPEDPPTAPTITAGEVLTDDYYFENEIIGEKVSITGSGNQKCIQEFEEVTFTLETNEHAQCKWSRDEAGFDYQTMEGDWPLELNAYTFNHTIKFSTPSVESLDAFDITETLEEMYGSLKINVRCQDYWENYNFYPYEIDFCVSDVDTRAPRIQKFDPDRGGILKYETTETLLKLWTDEPSECRYSTNSRTDYENMLGTMTCKNTDLSQRELYGWPCTTTLTGLEAGQNDFYFRCKDKPWELDDANRHTMQYDEIYNVFVTEEPLVIDDIWFVHHTDDGERPFSSGETIETGFEPVSVDLKMETSGGAYNGNAICAYSFLKYSDNMPIFKDTFTTQHEQNFNMLMGGDYFLYLKCYDVIGNEVLGTANLSIDVDSLAPLVVRAYQESGKLKLITNEDAICYYNDFDACNPFNFENATAMASSYSSEHSAAWENKKTYYIKCEDFWGNVNPDCAIKVMPDSLL